jgi:asparagine synthase (glutamine-hydrolysing)
MCGILGAIGTRVDPRAVHDALATLAHRGPDGEGSLHDAAHGLYLGHRRLSIVDLSESGRQPMTNEDGSLALTFNGEIYNHLELRRGLEARGHVFKSRCDAEVILHLYEERGAALVDELRGMFAFGLYDFPRRKLLLARDRLGIKPLFYYQDDGLFAFASELKAIRALPGADLTPDVTAYYDFLTYRFVPAPKTIYRRARKLPAGHVLELEDGRARTTRWWDAAERALALDPRAAEAELEERLRDAVSEHLMADVEIGLFLSAGIDSCLVAAHARAQAGGADRPLRAFTISFPGRTNDEAEAAGRMAAALGAVHRIGTYTGSAADVARLPDVFDEPFADHSALPMLHLSELAAREVKVVLSGDGGDETHAGYGRYRKGAQRDRLFGLLGKLPGRTHIPARALGAPWVRDLREDPLGWRHSFHSGIPRETKRLLLDFHSREFDDYDDYWLRREHDRPELPPLARKQYFDLVTLLPEGGLTKVDRTSMRYGLEVRPPLLDHRLVELALAVPDARRSSPEGKPLLRAALRRVLPAYDFATPKMGFSLPLKQLVVEGGLFRLPRDVEVFDAFRLDRAKVERILTPRRNSYELFLLYVLASFVGALAGSAPASAEPPAGTVPEPAGRLR